MSSAAYDPDPFSDTFDEAAPSIPSLPDIPDDSAFAREEWATGPRVWYRGAITREYTTSTGKVFESCDQPSAPGRIGRNIRLRVVLTRKDGETANLGVLVNYDPDYLTAECVALAQTAEAREAGTMAAKARMTVAKIARFQKIAGTRLTLAPEGGFDITPLIGRVIYVRPTRGEKGYMEVAEFLHDVRADMPKTGELH